MNNSNPPAAAKNTANKNSMPMIGRKLRFISVTMRSIAQKYLQSAAQARRETLSPGVRARRNKEEKTMTKITKEPFATFNGKQVDAYTL
ncbi:MAG: hypothetical protein ACI4SH_05340, partial [Candidatus Scatosoma sp.]